MNGKKAKELRRMAEQVSGDWPQARSYDSCIVRNGSGFPYRDRRAVRLTGDCGRRMYQELKRNYLRLKRDHTGKLRAKAKQVRSGRSIT